MNGNGGIGDILDCLERRARPGGTLSIDQVLGIFGRRTYGPFLAFPALLAISPLGGIPGVPTGLALVTLLFSLQILAGRRHFWVPDLLRVRRLGADRLRGAVQALRPAARWMDRYLGQRLTALTGRGWSRIAAGLCALLALLVPPLEIIPFAATAPMGAIALLGLAVLMRDGVVMIVALVASIAALAAAALMLL
ncbi:hypothetical protein DDZ14_04610 [Maritimibacter sp. 55A14]|uniref:exopolysaccharide biosynthesis protein n=1 Tax=Maritimibacter sp. 55A14 TaxID=2174844 RepID=UPI000D616C94|nr:exopolysaccharide biosynthesis protein [Maritimibacter sp. 55A14]PWE33484.1 hypothetical protein DDZ14_04610 [Maritimibacter sp. 55A14]